MTTLIIERKRFRISRKYWSVSLLLHNNTITKYYIWHSKLKRFYQSGRMDQLILVVSSHHAEVLQTRVQLQVKVKLWISRSSTMPRVAYLKITIMHEPWLCCVFRRPSCMHMVYSWQGQLYQKKIVWGLKLEKVGRGGYGILRNCNFRERKIYHIPYECISFKTCKSPISHLIFM